MAAGRGYESFELTDMERRDYGREYDNLDRKRLDDVYGGLRDQVGRAQLSDPSRDELVNRMVYIDYLRRGEAETSFTNEVPEPPGKYDGRTIKSSLTRDKKEFLSKHLGVDVNVGDGPASRDLIRKATVTFGANSEQDGVKFEGVKVVVSKDKGKTFDYSNNKKNLSTINRFKELIEKAKEEHERTVEGTIDQEASSEGLTPNEDVTQDIASNVTEDIESLAWEREMEVIEQARGYS